MRLALSRRSGTTASYEDLLHKADPGLKLPRLANAYFVGKGYGRDNLQTYRAGRIGYVPVFEKIFRKDSAGWRRTNWFYNEVLPTCGNAVHTPRLLRTAQGDWLVASYFELIDSVEPMPSCRLFPAAVQFQKAVSSFRYKGSDPIIRDFRRAQSYSDGSEKLRRLLNANGRDAGLVSFVEDWLDSADVPRRFAHGDFSSFNCLACGTFLDLDKCGYYPEGYEYGPILGWNHRFDDVDGLQEFMRSQLGTVPQRTWVPLLYFATVFYSRKVGDPVDDTFILALFDRVLDLIAQEDTAAAACRLRA